MTDDEYVAYEFSKARTADGGRIHVKVRSDDGESRWVGLSADKLDALIAAGQGGTEGG